MYDVQHEYQHRSDDGASDQCDDFVDALVRNEEELDREEADAPQVTRPRETECDRRGKEPDDARFSELQVAHLEKKSARAQHGIGKDDERRRQRLDLVPQVAGVGGGGRMRRQC